MGNLSKVPHTYFTTVIIYFPILINPVQGSDLHPPYGTVMVAPILLIVIETLYHTRTIFTYIYPQIKGIDFWGKLIQLALHCDISLCFSINSLNLISVTSSTNPAAPACPPPPNLLLTSQQSTPSSTHS